MLIVILFIGHLSIVSVFPIRCVAYNLSASVRQLTEMQRRESSSEFQFAIKQLHTLDILL